MNLSGVWVSIVVGLLSGVIVAIIMAVSDSRGPLVFVSFFIGQVVGAFSGAFRRREDRSRLSFRRQEAHHRAGERAARAPLTMKILLRLEAVHPPCGEECLEGCFCDRDD